MNEPKTIKEIRFYKRRKNGTYNKNAYLFSKPVSDWEIHYDKLSKTCYTTEINDTGLWEIVYDNGTISSGKYRDLIYPLIWTEWEKRQERKKKAAEEKEKAIIEKINATIPAEFAPFVDFLRKNMKVSIYHDDYDYQKVGIDITIKDIEIASDFLND